MYYLGLVFLVLASSVGWFSYSRAESENVGGHVEEFLDAIDPPVIKRKPAHQAKSKKTQKTTQSLPVGEAREPASKTAPNKTN